MITVEEFNLMSVHERVTNVLAHGTELLERIYVFYVVKLYALGNFYVEIWYHQTTNRIDRVNSVKLDDVLHLYESQINISDLFS
ncbi:MAG: hypothetical protein H6541_04485 [Lentimicrobiaceae bacterium]|nr:hypothetical protein [Lentimicrobiaceae bacterium]MCO5265100.1 hypothetical protein [Lentimicrobium sp.]HPG33955.1 hypothetical protein [Lentimicrobium sp.]